MRASCRPFLALLLLTPAAVSAVTGPWQENPQSRVRLISAYTAAPRAIDAEAPGAAPWLGLEIVLQPHWHAYWKNSGDAGYAPALVLKNPEIAGAELLFPAPRRFELAGGLVAFGYEDHVVYPVRARLAAPGGTTLALRASVDYVVCSDECVPYRYDLALEQPLADVPVEDAEGRGLLGAAAAALPRSEAQASLHASARLEPGEQGAATLVLDLPAGSAAGADLFFESHELYRLGKPQRAATESAAVTRYRVPLQPRQVPAPELAPTTFRWTATGLLSADGSTFAVEGTSTATPAPASVFPGIVLWPLAGAVALGLLVWAVVAFARPRSQTP